MRRKPHESRRWFPPPEFYTDELCTRCGVCCGSTDGEPCEHLRRDAGGGYFCEIYESRFGEHQTADGAHSFYCVPIRFVIEHTGGYGVCRYVQEIRRIRAEMRQDCSDLGKREAP